jgi:hypothetical protein
MRTLSPAATAFRDWVIEEAQKGASPRAAQPGSNAKPVRRRRS